MQWYDIILKELDENKTYSSKELINLLSQKKPDLSPNTYRWSLNNMVRDGKLVRCGYNSYSLYKEILQEYCPIYSDTAEQLNNILSQKYPYVKFTIFETVLMNDFLNHLIAQNTIFIQVEKDSSIYVFRFLQEQGYRNIMYRPDRNTFNLYWSKNSLIVNDMISEAPLRKENSHIITLEKMLVDMYADKLISTTYSMSEYSDVISQAERKYRLDKSKLLRYAKRRNVQKKIKGYLEGGV